MTSAKKRRPWSRWAISRVILPAGAAALGSWVVDYAFWYSTLQVHILILMLAARLISAAVLSGVLGRGIGDALVATGVLDNTALGRERLEA